MPPPAAPIPDLDAAAAAGGVVTAAERAEAPAEALSAATGHQVARAKALVVAVDARLRPPEVLPRRPCYCMPRFSILPRRRPASMPLAAAASQRAYMIVTNGKTAKRDD